MWNAHFGPNKPRSLLRVLDLRTDAMTRAWCAHCRQGGPLSIQTLTALPSATLGEAWIRGEVRCPNCSKAAALLMARPNWNMGHYECWTPDDPMTAWRLRHHWRWGDALR